MSSWVSYLCQLPLHLRMLRIRYGPWRKLWEASSDPKSIQNRYLMRLLAANENTVFGKRHGFGSIRSVVEYKAAVPINSYEDLRELIENEIQGRGSQLTEASPVMYTQTSGTTGKAKLIPILSSTLEEYNRAQSISSYARYRAVKGIYSGKILAIVSPAVEGYLENGKAFGSMSGLVYKSMPFRIRERYVLPAELFELNDYQTKYRLMAAFALAEESISVLASANPSTFLRLHEVIIESKDELVTYLNSGDLSCLLQSEIEQGKLDAIRRCCKPNPQRAKQVQGLGPGFTFSDLWPDIKAVVTWTHGNCAPLLPKLKQLLPASTKILEMGYLSSEFTGTIAVDCEQNLDIPTFQDNFFEFISTNDWENGIRDTLTLHELKEGGQYYIIVTTAQGLYRYFINDIVEVTGHFNKTPAIKFVQKGWGVTNFTGEKLYEEQIVEAMQTLCSRLGCDFDFYVMLADEKSFSYTLYLEGGRMSDRNALTAGLNEQLAELNIEYRAKVDSGRLKPADVKFLRKGTGKSFKAHCIQQGQREAQFKVIHLRYRKDLHFPIEDYLQ